MKKLLFALGGFLMLPSAFGQLPAIIPAPVSITMQQGTFLLTEKTIITHVRNEELNRIAAGLAQRLLPLTGSSLAIRESASPENNTISLALSFDNTIADEGYRLTVNASGVRIIARKPAGIFYGIQTLLQLLPPRVGSTATKPGGSPDALPFVTIEDHPRFGWRGLMLDVARHFFTKQEVKDYIDQMARYKFNRLHLHLSDDQGWRIEIKSLPRLTEVGAWREDKIGNFGRFSPPAGEPKTYGGFYTHDDIRELVKYAKERYVEILPEIDMPGHSMAAIAAYPELTCTPGTYTVNAGEQLMVWPGGGQHFYGLKDNSLCPANEKVYEFIDKLFTEIAQLFPFEYIHMGGDETARNFWEKSTAIKDLMKKEKLKDLNEVQSYFVKRVEKIINGKGKKMIGWDEILDGGLAPNAAVMSWRGMKGGIEAARQGHDVVMSPTDFAYLDYMQGDASLEPPVYASLRLQKAYAFDPLPAGIDASRVKGGQANIWTEQIYNTRHLQYMMWPRGFAIAEALWSQPDKKDWKQFVQRVEAHFDRLDAANIKWSPALYDPIFEFTKKDTATYIVKMSTEVDGLSIHYSFDNSFPDQYYPAYTAPVTVPKDASYMKVITSRNGKLIGRMMTLPVSDIRKRAK